MEVTNKRRARLGMFEMGLLPLALYDDDSEVTIKDQVHFVFKDILQVVLHIHSW